MLWKFALLILNYIVTTYLLGHGRDSHYHQAAVIEVGAMVLQNMFSALSFLHYRKDDDFVDRLSYFYTSSFLTMMAVLVSFKQVGIVHL